MHSFLKRVLRALTLDAALFEEVEADRGATGQALGVVLLSGIAAGIGSTCRDLAGGMIVLMLAHVLAWGVWAVITYVIGTKILPGSHTGPMWGNYSPRPPSEQEEEADHPGSACTAQPASAPLYRCPSDRSRSGHGAGQF